MEFQSEREMENQYSEHGSKMSQRMPLGMAENPEGHWKKSKGDHRFTSFAKSVAINHAPWNIELNLALPTGISKNRLCSLINTTKALNHYYIQRKNVKSKESMDTKTRTENIPLRSLYLQYLKNSLKDTAFLKLNQLSLENEQKEMTTNSKLKSKPPLSGPQYALFQQIVSTFESRSRLLTYCVGSKDLNVAFQHYIMNTQPEILAFIRQKAVQELDSLMFHKHGNYLIQRLIQRDKISCHTIFKVCMDNFRQFGENEYSSRIMQVLIEVHPGFRAYVHTYFSSNIAFSYSKICVTFLLLIAMRHSDTSQEFQYVYDHLKRDPGLYEFKLFKRVLIGYFQFADYSMIGNMWSLILTIEPFEAYFDKKFSSLILLMVIRRNYEVALKQIAWYFSSRFSEIIKRKYSKVVAEKFLQPKYMNFRQLLCTALTVMKEEELKNIQTGSEENFNFYLYLTIASFKETQNEELEAYLRKIKHLVPTCLPQL